MNNMILSRDGNESITSLFSEGVIARFQKGEIVVQGDEEPTGVFYIQSGYIKAYSISQLGQKNLLLIHGANEIMPLPWALDGAQKLGIFYEALSDVIANKTSKNSLRASMGANTWLSEQIMRQLVNTFTVYAQRIQNLGYRLPRERVIACLLDLATRFGHSRGQDIIITVPITHQDIADSINTTRETASRALQRLVIEGLVAQEEHLFIIKKERNLLAELG